MKNNLSLKAKCCLSLVLGLGLSLCLGVSVAQAQCPNSRCYVDADGMSLTPDGMSWTLAYTNLQDALAVSRNGDEIWVAEGVYYPDEGGGQTNNVVTASFALTDGVEIYGGFAGTETSRSQRQPRAKVTVLSGDIDGDDIRDGQGVVTTTDNIRGNNAYNVIRNSGVSRTAVLDGFTITAGDARIGGCPIACGGGMYNDSSSPQLTQISFRGNSAKFGGGMYNDSSSRPEMRQVSFSGNRAADNGGGMYNFGSRPEMRQVSFSGNRAADNGGGMYNLGSNPEMRQVSFSGNAADNGGGMYNQNSSQPQIVNSIFWGNAARGQMNAPAQIHNSGSSSPAISYTLVQSSGGSGLAWESSLGRDGGNNLDADPQFREPIDPAQAPTSAGNLRLEPGSPAIDVGDNNAVRDNVDLAGAPRIQGGRVDLGAYERSVPGISLSKAVSPVRVEPDQRVTYTLVLSNSGLGSDSVSLSDTLPNGVEFAAWGEQGGAVENANEISWQGTVTAGESITITFLVSNLNLSGPITNRAQFSGSLQTGSSSVSHTVLQVSPLAADDTYSTTEDTRLTIISPTGVLSNDGDLNGDSLAASVQSDVSSGTLDLQVDGSFVYTPAADVNGLDYFSYQVSDGVLTDTALVTITIAAVNDGPVAFDDTARANEDVAVSISVLSNDTDVDNSRLFLAAVSPAQSGTTSISGQQVVYSPSLNFAGTDSFTYRVSDGSLSDTASVSVTVNAVNDAPVAEAGADQSVRVSQRVTLDGSLSSDVEGDALSYGWQQTGGVNVTLNRPSLSRTTFTAPALPTVLTFSLSVTDGPGLASRADEVVITVKDEAIAGLRAQNSSPIVVRERVTVTAHIISGTNVSYAWDFGDGNNAVGQIVSHVYTQARTYTARVEASNSSNILTATTRVTITDEAIAGLSVQNSSPTAANEVVTFTAQITAGEKVSYTWDFGDGGNAVGQIATHVYTQAGTYSATVEASNSTNSLTATTRVTIKCPNGRCYVDANVMPQTMPIRYFTAYQGVAYSYTVRISPSLATPVYTLSAPYKPAWLDFVDHRDNTGTLMGVPGAADQGKQAVTILATDGQVSSTAVFTISVVPNQVYLPTGMSWRTAYTNLQDALAVSRNGDEIWVAEGVYYPDEGGGQTKDDVMASFTLTDGVEIYGGFAGTETSRSQRQPRAKVTVLSGDIDGDDIRDGQGVVTTTDNIRGNNAYNVIRNSGVSRTAVLDGFTITAGDARIGGCPIACGGGMYNDSSSPQLTQISFRGNSAKFGGGMYNDSSSRPEMRQVSFSGNRAADNGGGMYNFGSRPEMRQVSFSGNRADNGGGMYNFGSRPEMRQVSFSGNAADNGGGMYNQNSSQPQIVNSIFWGNAARGQMNAPAQIHNSGSSSPAISYTLVQSSGGSGLAWESSLGRDGGNNLDADPQFREPIDPAQAPTSAGNLRLEPGSPAIDVGDNNAVRDNVDLAGAPRIQGGRVDLGAYERSVPGISLSKAVSPVMVEPDQRVTYTLVLSNSGLGSDSVSLSDTLPSGVEFAAWGEQGGAVENANEISWRGTVTAGESITITFEVSNLNLSGPITNRAQFSGSLQTGSSSVSHTVLQVSPLAADDTYSTTEDTRLTIISPTGVLSNDGDLNGDSLAASVQSDVSSGTLDLQVDGSFVYTPAAQFNGQDYFSYQVSDGVLSDTASVTIIIRAVNDGPVARDDTASTAEDEAVSISVLSNDADIENDSLSLAEVSLAQNGRTGISGKQVVYSPNLNFAGTDSFTYRVSDGSLSDTASVTITIAAVNDGPVAIDDTARANEDEAVSISVLSNDVDIEDDSLSLTAVSPAQNGRTSISGKQVVYSPSLNFEGTDSFTYSVSDGSLSDTASVTVTVQAVNDGPVAIDDTASTNEDEAVSISVLSNDADIEDDSLSLTAVSPAQNGRSSISGQQVVYSPNLNFEGTDSFTYRVSDGVLNDTALVTITIAAVNDGPVARDDTASTKEDEAVSISVLSNDADIEDDSLSLVAANISAQNGRTSISGQQVVYSPSLNFAGTDSFTYIVSDGRLSDTASVTVTVEAVNDGPVAIDDTASTNEDEAVSISVLSNDADVDNSSLSLTAVSPAQNGRTGISGQQVVYSPSLNFEGTDSFTYRVSDGVLNDTALVTITIAAVNDAPLAEAGADQSVRVSQRVTLDGSRSRDVEGDALRYGWQQTGGARVTLNRPSLSRTTFTVPALPTILTFRLSVTDEQGLVSRADEVVITVTDEAIAGLRAQNSSPVRVQERVTVTAHILAGTNVSYTWDFGDGEQASGTSEVSHVYPQAGTYTARVLASNSINTLTATTLVSITPIIGFRPEIEVSDYLSPVLRLRYFTAYQGVAYSYTVKVSPSLMRTQTPHLLETQIYTLSAPSKPAWLDFVDHQDNTGILRGVPEAADQGEQAVTILARDGQVSSTAVLTITVGPNQVYLPLVLR